MAASPKPIQGSLFGENLQEKLDADQIINTSNSPNESLSNKRLKEDSSLRPRKKKKSENLNKIINLDEFSKLLISCSVRQQQVLDAVRKIKTRAPKRKFNSDTKAQMLLQKESGS